MATRPREGEFPIAPPVEPMLAKLADELPPAGDYLYEPKWDGFRAIVFRGDDERLHPEPRPAAARSLLSRAARGAARRAAEGLRARRRDRDRDGARARLRRAAAAAASGGVARGEAREGNALLVRRLRSAGGRTARNLHGDAAGRAPRRLEELLAEIETPVYLTPVTRDRAVALDWLDALRRRGPRRRDREAGRASPTSRASAR